MQALIVLLDTWIGVLNAVRGVLSVLAILGTLGSNLLTTLISLVTGFGGVP